MHVPCLGLGAVWGLRGDGGIYLGGDIGKVVGLGEVQHMAFEFGLPSTTPPFVYVTVDKLGWVDVGSGWLEGIDR